MGALCGKKDKDSSNDDANDKGDTNGTNDDSKESKLKDTKTDSKKNLFTSTMQTMRVDSIASGITGGITGGIAGGLNLLDGGLNLLEGQQKKDPYDPEEMKARFDLMVPENNWVDNLEDQMKFITTLGTGSTSKVMLGVDHTKHKNNNKDSDRVAIKQMEKDEKYRNLRAFERELRILEDLKHTPHIMSLLTSYIDNDHFYIVTKYYYGGNLLDFISKNEHCSEQQTSYLVKTILTTVEFIHSKNIAHCDLNPGNILFNKIPVINRDYGKEGKEYGFANDAKLVIIDFGNAIDHITDTREYKSKKSSIAVGNVLYKPPEITRGRKGWEVKSGDIFAVGIIAYILICGKPPFHGATRQDTLHLVGTQPLHWPNKKSIQVSDRCKSFINGLLSKVSRTRFTAESALQDPWIVDNKNNSNKNSVKMNKELLSNIADFRHADALKLLLVDHVISEMTAKEREILKRGFKTLDHKHNGVVTKNDIYVYLVSIGISKEEAKEKAHDMMTMMDSNNKGKITYDDFAKAQTLSNLKTHYGSDSELEMKSIELLDPKHTGRIDATLLEEKVTKLGKNQKSRKFLDSVKHEVTRSGKVDNQTVARLGSRSPSLSEVDMTEVDVDADVGVGDVRVDDMDMDVKDAKQGGDEDNNSDIDTDSDHGGMDVDEDNMHVALDALGESNANPNNNSKKNEDDGGLNAPNEKHQPTQESIVDYNLNTSLMDLQMDQDSVSSAV